MFDFNSITQPKTIKEAVSALAANPAARVMAGGTDLLIGLRDGVGVGGDFVSIGDIEEMRGIGIGEDGAIHIKAGTTFREIADSEVLQQRLPYFIDACSTIGSQQIRTTATIGGNISNGFTTADAPPTLLALDAVAVVTGPDGARQMPVEKYYLAPEKMDLKTGELLTEVVIPRESYLGSSGCYIKYAVRDAMDIALLGCAVVVKPDKALKKIEDIRIAFGAAAGIPIRVRVAEEKLKGAAIDEALFETIGQYCAQELSPITDKRAGKEFRLHLARVLPGRAFKKALENLGYSVTAK